MDSSDTSSPDRSNALEMVEVWSSSHAFAPPRLQPHVTGVTTEPLTYARLVTVIRTRTPTWRARAYAGSEPRGAAPVDENSVRPWHDDALELAARSRHVASCGPCSGAGASPCDICQGSGHIACPNCHGSGQQVSERTNRLINCKLCRGKARIDCPDCDKGSVRCATCNGSGKTESWLDCQESERVEVRVAPRSDHLESHPGLFDQEPGTRAWDDATLDLALQQDGPLPAAARAQVSEALGHELSSLDLDVAIDARTERVVRQEVEVFSAPLTRSSYRLAGGTGHVALLGASHSLTRDREDAPLIRLQIWTVACAIIAVVLALLCGGLYAAADPFYRGQPALVFSAGATLLAAGFFTAMMAWLRYSGRHRTRARNVSFALAAVALVVMGSAAIAFQPSLSTARDFIASGELSRAERHLEALRRRGQDGAEMVSAYAALILARADQARGVEAVAQLEAAPEDIRAHPDMQARLLELRIQELGRLLGSESHASAAGQAAAFLDDIENARLPETARDALERTLSDRARILLEREAPAGVIELLQPIEGRLQGGTRELLVQAYVASEARCGDESVDESVDDMGCRIDALSAAARVQTTPLVGQGIERLRTRAVERVDGLLARGDEVARKLAALAEAERYLDIWRKSELPWTPELEERVERARLRREAVLRGHHVVGEPLIVARERLGRLDVHGASLWRLPTESNAVFLQVNEREVVRGVLIVAEPSGSTSLSPGFVQDLAERMVGARFKEKVMSNRKAGIRHVKTRVGKHKAELGWDGDDLVEVIIGRFEP